MLIVISVYIQSIRLLKANIRMIYVIFITHIRFTGYGILACAKTSNSTVHGIIVLRLTALNWRR